MNKVLIFFNRLVIEPSTPNLVNISMNFKLDVLYGRKLMDLWDADCQGYPNIHHKSFVLQSHPYRYSPQLINGIIYPKYRKSAQQCKIFELFHGDKNGFSKKTCCSCRSHPCGLDCRIPIPTAECYPIASMGAGHPRWAEILHGGVHSSFGIYIMPARNNPP
jgi:hypothetical protein